MVSWFGLLHLVLHKVAGIRAFWTLGFRLGCSTCFCSQMLCYYDIRHYPLRVELRWNFRPTPPSHLPTPTPRSL